MVLAVVVILCISFIIGVSGIGGFLFPPIIMSVLDIGIRQAIVTSLGSFILITVALSLTYYKQKMVNTYYGWLLVLGALPGIALGLRVNLIFSEKALINSLAAFLLLMGISLVFKRFSRNKAVAVSSERDIGKKSFDRKIIRSKAALVAAGFLGGTMAGFIGVGGPVVTIPFMLNAGYEPKESIGSSTFSAVFIVSFAFLAHLRYTEVSGYDVVLLGLLGVTGSFVGAYFVGQIKESTSNSIITVVTLFSAIYIFLFR